MKKIIVLTLLFSSFTIFASLAQCPSRPYTQEWDWRGPSNYTFIVPSDVATNTTEPPWFAVVHNNANINSFRLQTPKEYEPTDGWVLMQRDFGTITNPVSNPYFVLYNKFSGILRIFVAVTKVYGPYNSAVITLKYNNPGVRSAVLENHTKNVYRSALDDFDNQILEINVPNVYGNDLPYWLHADFVMNYDPCTCNNLSQLVFDARLITTANLAFQLNGTAVQGLDATGNGSSGKQSLAKGTQGVVDAGNSFYKSGEEGLSHITTLFPGLTVKSDALGLEKLIPGLGAAVGVVDFLSGLFGGSASQPIAYDINLKATGNITTSDPYKTVIFETPGSANLTLVPSTKLNYNNIMGVFNLINTPKVIGSQAIVDLPGQPLITLKKKYKITEDLAYAINPQSGFDVNSVDIKCAIVFEFVPNSASNISNPENTLVDEGIVYDNKRIHRTKFLPIGCIGDLSVSFDQVVPRDFVGNTTPSVYLRIIAVLKSSLNTNANKGIFISKYKVDWTGDNSLFDQANYWPSTLSNIPDDVTIENTTISNDVRAWNTITIGPGVNIPNGVNLYVYCGE